jgi:DNA-binding GntR family transcriptional regulator
MAVDRAARTPRERNNAQRVYLTLRESILSGETPAGEKLSQVALAREHEVSRGPVREALRLLEREGLIHAEVNHRARVTALSPSDLEEIYAMRITLESMSLAAGVPRLSADDFRELEVALQEMEDLTGVDAERWAVPHARFHEVLVSHVGERTLGLMRLLYEHSERYRRIYLAQGPRMWVAGVAEHHEIVEACAAGDQRSASVLLARHLSRTALTVLTVVAPEYDPALVRASVRQIVDGENDAQLSPSRSRRRKGGRAR